MQQSHPQADLKPWHHLLYSVLGSVFCLQTDTNPQAGSENTEIRSSKPA